MKSIKIFCGTPLFFYLQMGTITDIIITVTVRRAGTHPAGRGKEVERYDKEER